MKAVLNYAKEIEIKWSHYLSTPIAPPASHAAVPPLSRFLDAGRFLASIVSIRIVGAKDNKVIIKVLFCHGRYKIIGRERH